MTRYILDTIALIDFSKSREPTRSRIFLMIEAGDELGVCAVNVAEFYAGLPVIERPQWDEFFSALRYWGITQEAARQAGMWRFEFRRRGNFLTTTDMLIAAVAQERGAVILTDNITDYPIDEVRVLPLKA